MIWHAETHLILVRDPGFQADHDSHPQRQYEERKPAPEGKPPPQISDLRIGKAEQHFGNDTRDRISDEEKTREHSGFHPFLLKIQQNSPEYQPFQQTLHQWARKMSDALADHGERSGVSRISIELAVQVIGDPSQENPERNGHSHLVSNRPQIFFHKLGIAKDRDRYPDNTSVKTHSPLPNREYF